ncbi:MAG: Asp-tRNA(Asn)/Glu-tRNA(Gln) amidotransferase subunit GatC [Brasilonema angustatum HA4187-MV1]|jgi:aspartyl-tRNA(Asn)/glutamyl-tRNA(Gln) amidotransferase subunit C|nr:Asp-tRNA(Asn)/Glu-tRNA(Gln) amidotransferase subunit GatC [Brasilonema angustatum HA4187-MV1]
MIDREQVHKVAHLARLELTSEEEEKFTTQLGSILDYFEQLSELDVNNVPPTLRAIDVKNVTRADDLQAYPNREDILESAPEQEGNFFKVPKILNEQ